MPRQTRRSQTLGQGAFRHLTGAENHCIHFDKRLLAVFNNPQAILVNPLVADPGMKTHTVAFHLGAVDPARGFAQVRPRLPRAAVQYMNLPRRDNRFWRRQATGQGRSRGNAPVSEVFIHRLRPIAQKKRGDIKGDDAGADNRHPLANRFGPGQRLGVIHDQGQIGPGYRYRARRGAGGYHPFIEAAQFINRNRLTQPRRNAIRHQHLFIIANDPAEFLLAGDTARQKQLAADGLILFKERHLMATGGGGDGAGKTGRAGADDGDFFRGAGWLEGPLCFFAGPGIDQAGAGLAGKDAVEATLIAGDAGIDPRRLAVGRLIGPFRVGEHRPGQADHVGAAIGKHLFGHHRRIDAVTAHDRHGQRRLHLLAYRGESRSRHDAGDGRHPRLMPANAGIDQGNAGFFQGPPHGQGFVPGRAVFHQIYRRHTENDDKLVRGRLANARNNGQGETRAAGEIAAPFVIPLVDARREKLVEQIAFGTHDFDAVVTGLFRQFGTVDVILYGGEDLFPGQGVRRNRDDRRANRRRRHRAQMRGVAPGMEYLHTDFAARRMNRVGDDLMARHLRRLVQRHGMGHTPARRVGGNAAGDNQPDAALGPGSVIGGQAHETILFFFQAGVHRTHQQAVFQSDAIGQSQGLKQMWESR